MAKKKTGKTATRTVSRARVGAAPGSPGIEAALQHAGQLHNAGELGAAEAIYRALLRTHCGEHRALFLLGVIAFQREQFAEAHTLFEQAVSLAGNIARYHLLLGYACQGLGHAENAISALRRARELDPTLFGAWHTEAIQLLRLGEHAAAERCALQAILLDSRAAAAYQTLGEVQLAQGRAEQAEAQFQRAAALDARFVEPLINLGVLSERRGQLERARAWFEKARALRPDSAVAHFNLGWIAQKQGRLVEAAAHFRKALECDCQHANAMLDLAGVLHELGDADAALALYREALTRDPLPATHSSLLSLMLYHPSIEPMVLVAEARAWGNSYGSATAASAQPRRRDLGSARLRVGYVSPDFRQHSVSYFFEPLLRAHDKERFEVHCYSATNDPDEVTARLEQHARFRSIHGLSDANVAEQVRADGIDILVDLAGHTAGSRLAVFGHRPAPIQITYLGYPGTTGVPAIDFRITDAFVDPPSTTDTHYTETLIRLPEAFCCFSPPEPAPHVSELPALERGYVTFGSLNNYTKLSRPVLQAWASVLERVPGSRLILQSRPFLDPAVCELLWGRFGEVGVARERVQLHGPMALDAHLRLYEQIDIGLDTFPWNGHTTTCLALHMGVPVVALAGTRCAARMGVSVLTHAGLANWLAPSMDAYVDMAVARARDIDALSKLRRGLRLRVATSPLCDAQRFTRGLEAAYRGLFNSRQAE